MPPPPPDGVSGSTGATVSNRKLSVLKLSVLND